MNQRLLRAFLCFVMILQSLAVSPLALACSAFRLPLSSSPHILVGRNFDWDFGHGLIIANKRGVAKRAIRMHASDSVTWVSKYGSLTFNQAGRELPYGGVNEKGLMIEVLWLGWTAWPVTSAPSINEVQWIQYQLDTRQSVADLVSHIGDASILSVFAKVHFFVCDATGECATIEGRGDHVEIRTGASLPYAALTNDPYDTSSKSADAVLLNGACGAIPASSSRSLDRFDRATCALEKISEQPSSSVESNILKTDSILDSLAQGAYTKWRIVYDLTAKSISIRTNEAATSKSVSLSGFDFSCSKPAQVLDLNFNIDASSADVGGKFKDYDVGSNRKIVEASLLNGFAHLDQATVDNIVAFPDTTACVAP